MASLPSLQYEDSQAVFDLLSRQFSLDENVLIDLTKTFLEEFKTGLGSYNHPMAMMWVLI
jgi:hexokinase